MLETYPADSCQVGIDAGSCRPTFVSIKTEQAITSTQVLDLDRHSLRVLIDRASVVTCMALLWLVVVDVVLLLLLV